MIQLIYIVLYCCDLSTIQCENKYIYGEREQASARACRTNRHECAREIRTTKKYK